MSRYGNRFKDNLYDDLVYQFENSRMSASEFVAIVLEMLATLLREAFIK